MAFRPIRYAKLGYAQVQVTNLDASIAFYRDVVGLVVDRLEGKVAWLRCSDKPYDIILVEGEVAGLSAVGFELENRDELDSAFAHIESLGYAPRWTAEASAREQYVEAAFRFRNPDTGLEIDLFSGQGKAATPFVPTVARITRLGHVVLNVKSYENAHRFWVEHLGFAISDHVPGKISFLRCWPNPLHHTLALLERADDGLNHFNFMVSDIDDIGCAMNRVKKANVPIVFGPGRHLPSTSIFLYFLDPDGMTTEYSFGMEEIHEGDERDPRELDPTPEVLDTWGSIADPRFGTLGAIIGSHG